MTLSFTKRSRGLSISGIFPPSTCCRKKQSQALMHGTLRWTESTIKNDYPNMRTKKKKQAAIKTQKAGSAVKVALLGFGTVGSSVAHVLGTSKFPGVEL